MCWQNGHHPTAILKCPRLKQPQRRGLEPLVFVPGVKLPLRVFQKATGSNKIYSNLKKLFTLEVFMLEVLTYELSKL